MNNICFRNTTKKVQLQNRPHVAGLMVFKSSLIYDKTTSGIVWNTLMKLFYLFGGEDEDESGWWLRPILSILLSISDEFVFAIENERTFICLG